MADAAIETAETEETAPERAKEAKRWMLLRRLATVVILAGIGWGVWYLLVGRNHVATDNAYVNAEVAQVTPLVSGTVREVRVRDTQMVKAGDVLVILDDDKTRIALAQAEADLADARRRFRQAVATTGAMAATVSARGAEITRAEAQSAAAQADFETARIDLARREKLAASGAVSGEELSEARKAFATARAAVASAQAAIALARSTRVSAEGELAATQALVRGSTEETDPAVMAAKARLESARIDQGNTVIRAPVDGVVTRRQVQVGQRVNQGAQVMTIVPVGKVYIDANFKERQLRKVRIGMPATVTADIYGGDVIYRGKVAGIAGGTGASMALIPAQNATGNWIKVVQRLPVRIELDPAQLRENPLRVGLSTEVEIDISGD